MEARDSSESKAIDALRDFSEAFLEEQESMAEQLILEVGGARLECSSLKGLPVAVMKPRGAPMKQVGPGSSEVLFFEVVRSTEILRATPELSTLQQWFTSSLMPGAVLKVKEPGKKDLVSKVYLGTWIVVSGGPLVVREDDATWFYPMVYLALCDFPKTQSIAVKLQAVALADVVEVELRMAEGVVVSKAMMKLAKVVDDLHMKEERKKRAAVLLKDIPSPPKCLEGLTLDWYQSPDSLQKSSLIALYDYSMALLYAMAGYDRESKDLVSSRGGPVDGDGPTEMQTSYYIEIIIFYCTSRGIKSLYDLAMSRPKAYDLGGGVGTFDMFLTLLGFRVMAVERNLTSYTVLATVASKVHQAFKNADNHISSKVVDHKGFTINVLWDIVSVMTRHLDPARTYHSDCTPNYDMLLCLTSQDDPVMRASMLPLTRQSGRPVTYACQLRGPGQLDRIVKWGVLDSTRSAKTVEATFAHGGGQRTVAMWEIKDATNFIAHLNALPDDQLPEGTPRFRKTIADGFAESETGGGDEGKKEESEAEESEAEESEAEEERSNRGGSGMWRKNQPEDPSSFPHDVRVRGAKLLADAKSDLRDDEMQRKTFFKTLNSKLRKAGSGVNLNRTHELHLLAGLSYSSLSQWRGWNFLSTKHRQLLEYVRARKYYEEKQRRPRKSSHGSPVSARRRQGGTKAVSEMPSPIESDGGGDDFFGDSFMAVDDVDQARSSITSSVTSPSSCSEPQPTHRTSLIRPPTKAPSTNDQQLRFSLLKVPLEELRNMRLTVDPQKEAILEEMIERRETMEKHNAKVEEIRNGLGDASLKQLEGYKALPGMGDAFVEAVTELIAERKAAINSAVHTAGVGRVNPGSDHALQPVSLQVDTDTTTAEKRPKSASWSGVNSSGEGGWPVSS